MKLRDCISLSEMFVASHLLAFSLAPAARAAPFDWGINEDYKQLDARGATDFDILLKGNVAGNITGGGMSATTNPFATPTLTTMPDAFGNTIVHFSGANTIASDANTNRHFGIFGTGTKPTVLAKAWSYAAAPTRVAVPLANLMFQYNPGAATLTFLVQNTSSDTITLQDAGYLTTSSEFSIDALNRSALPPSSFIAVTSLDHQYLPGASDEFVLTGVPMTDFATMYGTVLFSGDSAGNPYDSTGGEWAEVAVAAAAVPEAGSLALLLVGLAGVIAVRIRWRRYRGAVPLSLVTLVASAAGFVPAARADVFVLKLLPSVADDLPTIQIGATVGGMPVNVNAVVVDTGAGLGLVMNNASATALGLNLAAGTPAAAAGVGGAAAVTNGVPLPAGVAPTGGSAPITPGGQATKSPAFPATTTVSPLPAVVNGLVGSPFLADYNYGFTGTLPSKYLFLARKNEGAAGLATATAIASFLSGIALGPGGVPAATKTASLTPTPPPNLPGTMAFDSGYDLNTQVATATGGSPTTAPFMLKTNLPTTLITESLALSLGLDLASLPTVDVLGDFGTIAVLEATLDFNLFPGTGFPDFVIAAGILNPAEDPLGFNYLGDDILGSLPFWEVTVDQAGDTIFSAAVVPEPMAMLLFAEGIFVLVLIGAPGRSLVKVGWAPCAGRLSRGWSNVSTRSSQVGPGLPALPTSGERHSGAAIAATRRWPTSPGATTSAQRRFPG